MRDVHQMVIELDETFESGLPATLTQRYSTTINGVVVTPNLGTITVDPAAAHSGVYGVKIVAAKATVPAGAEALINAYLSHWTTNFLANDIFARFYIKIPDHLPASYSGGNILEMDTDLAGVQLRINSEDPTPNIAVFSARYLKNGVVTALVARDSSANPIQVQLNRWYCVEVHARKGAGVGLGLIEIYIDGVLAATDVTDVTGATWYGIHLGMAPNGTSTFDSYRGTETLLIDDYKIADTYIGPSTAPTDGTLTVTTTQNGVSVSGASVTVGGQTKTSPASFTLVANTYTVSATYLGATQTQSATVVAGQTTTINFDFPQIANGYAVIYAYAGGTAINATVTADGQTGTTPVTFTFPAGTYSVTATYQGQTLPAQSVTITAGQTATITFQFPAPRTLTIVASNGGVTSPAAGTHPYDDGASVSITAIPNTGFSLSYWIVDGVNAGSANPITVTMSANHTVTPIFTQITWTLTILPVTGGTTSPAAGTSTRNDGTQVTITATPLTGYMFDHWMIDGVESGTSNTVIVTMTANHTVEAVFQVIVRTLTVVAAVGGSTNPPAGAYPYNHGSTAQVSATASTGYRFSNWIVNGTNAGSVNPINITMNADATVTPVFVQDTITVNVVAGANGAVSPSGLQTLVIGTAYSFAALPNTSYVFDHWDMSGANIGSTNPLSLTATADKNGKTLTALFALYVPPPITLTIAVAPTGAGTTTPPIGQTQVTPGTVAQFTATRVAGWDFVQWQLDGTAYANNPLNLPIVQSMNGQTLTAVFTQGKVTVTVAATVGGTVSPSGPQVLTIGNSYSYTATASQGFVFDHWELGGVSVGANPTYQFIASLDMDGKTLLAVFAAAKISLYVNAAANGSVSPFGQQTLTVGTRYTFGAFPNNGYKLDHWDLAGANLGSTNPLQITAALGMDGQTLTAFFRAEETTPPQITMALAVTPAAAGSTSPPVGSNVFNVGDLVQFTVTPSGDYQFVQWTLDGMTFSENPLNLTIAQNMQGKTLTAQLAIPQVAVTVTADANGSVSPTGTQTLIVGRSYQFAAVGKTGYALDHWELAGQDLGSANPITLTPTVQNDGQTLTAFFRPVAVQAGFPWWTLAIAIPSAVAFTYIGTSPSGAKKKRRR